jgi:hypothetical protein
MHIERWYLYEGNVMQLQGSHIDAAFDWYLTWFHERARLRLRPA